MKLYLAKIIDTEKELIYSFHELEAEEERTALSFGSIEDVFYSRVPKSQLNKVLKLPNHYYVFSKEKEKANEILFYELRKKLKYEVNYLKNNLLKKETALEQIENLIDQNSISFNNYTKNFLLAIDFLERETSKSISLEMALYKLMKEKEISNIVKNEFKKFRGLIGILPLNTSLDKMEKDSSKEMQILIDTLRKIEKKSLKECLQETKQVIKNISI